MSDLVEQMKKRLLERKQQRAQLEAKPRGEEEETPEEREARLIDDESIWDNFSNRGNIIPASTGMSTLPQ